MLRSLSTQPDFHNSKYQVSQETLQSSKIWEKDFMYKTSYFKQSEKNVTCIKFQPSALKNSTEQLLNTRSLNLNKTSSGAEFFLKSIDSPDYIRHDYNNMYRTSYNDMNSKVFFIKLET